MYVRFCVCMPGVQANTPKEPIHSARHQQQTGPPAPSALGLLRHALATDSSCLLVPAVTVAPAAAVLLAEWQLVPGQILWQQLLLQVITVPTAGLLLLLQSAGSRSCRLDRLRADGRVHAVRTRNHAPLLVCTLLQ